MKKRASGRGKIRTEIWVALIGLAGIIVTAIFGSPVLIKLLERTPTPTALVEEGGNPPVSSTSRPALPTASGAVPASDCQPAGITELPAAAMAAIESIDNVKASVSLASLRYEYQTGLRLASGIIIDFNKMKRVDLFNPNFTDDFTVEVTITLLDCSTHTDAIQSESGSNLMGDSSFGAFELHILQVKSIVFEW